MRFAVISLTLIALALGTAQTAEAHGWRHGKNLTASQMMRHPTWLKMPEHECSNLDHENDVAVTYDDDLGWMIVWRCTCKPHPNGITHICWWRPVRILPESVSNRRILTEIRRAHQGRRHTRPRWANWGYVYRVHHRTNGCHWHDEDRGMVIWSRPIR